MTTLTLDLPTDVFARLKQRAAGAGKPIETVASELLVEQMSQPLPEPHAAREAVWDILRDAGLLAELTPSEQRRGAEADASLDEVSAALDGAGGPDLSDLIIEMRGPKV